MTERIEAFEEDPAPTPAADEPLIVDLEGYEGPLDVLLALAREQKVDITRISILQLADQYLDFIERARQVRLEIAADYLVMAAWLAYLKSRLLLPEPEEEEPTGEELAERLAFQLKRLEAMRNAAERLMAMDRGGIDFFLRGQPDGVTVIRNSRFECTIFELLQAYAEHKEAQGNPQALRLTRDRVFSIERAVERLQAMLGNFPDWATLQAFLPVDLRDPFARRSATASTLAGALELAKQGRLQMRQGKAFGPIYMRARERSE